MRFEKAYIPYRAYWSSPFVRWQGSLATAHPLELAAATGRTAFEQRGLDPGCLDGIALGLTIPYRSALYAGPWVAAMLGAPGITGPTVMQACATGARTVAMAATQVELGSGEVLIALTADRCSNGPHLVYPDPEGPGGRPQSEDWVWDSFGHDPHAGNSMVETAENVAQEAGISREAQEECTFLRWAQYQGALADDRAFQRGYMVGCEVGRRKRARTIDADEGPFMVESKARGMKPVLPGGSVTFATQTYPADGNAGLLVTTAERAIELAADATVSIQLRSYGEARTKKGFMAMAVVPAARKALDVAGLEVGEMAAIQTHNPFAVNDIYMAQQLGVELGAMNRHGSSLIYGHPQGPTGMRGILELIETLVREGGGHGLFAGCAAGDSAAAVVVTVTI